MCGRMTLTRSGSEIAEYFAQAIADDGIGAVTEFDGSPLRARYNIAPSQEIPTLVAGPDGDADGGLEIQWKKWGLVPSWTKDAATGGRLFNARSETADVKPSFRSAWKRRRCLVVADGFYEWTPRARGHQPYHFRRPQGSLLALAGLYETWQGEGGEIIESCTVLTTEANKDLEGVHHRMPVILDSADVRIWLDPRTDPGSLKALMRPAASGTLERNPVTRRTNSPQFDDPECLLPDPDPDPDSNPEADPVAESAQGDLFRQNGERAK
jgi:putative SOS response-associated peptidase YedK